MWKVLKGGSRGINTCSSASNLLNAEEAMAMEAINSRDSWADIDDDHNEAHEVTRKKPTPMPQGGLFKEVNDLRAREPPRPPTDENAKYKKDFFGRLAANGRFQGLTFFFIGLNSLYIGFEADWSARNVKPDDTWHKDTPIFFIFMENLFAVYFTAEVVIRFIAYKRKLDCCTDGWFVFDSILVSFMVLELWLLPIMGVGANLSQLSVLRLLRLLRISRMARLMKKIPELMIIIKGLVASVRSVGCTGILQVLILYVFSILFVSEYHYSDEDVYLESTEWDGDKIESMFGTMGKSFFSLFIYGTVLDDVTYCTDMIRGRAEGKPSGSANMPMLFLFIIFILMSSFTILNMLIGILCEVVAATADSETVKAAETSVRDAITSLFDKLDVDKSGTISEEEFLKMRDDQDVRSALEDMDIYESHFARYCELLFHKDDAKNEGKKPVIDFETLISMILQLSPGNHINALDFSLLQASIDRTQDALRDRILKITELIQLTAQKCGAELPAMRRHGARPDDEADGDRDGLGSTTSSSCIKEASRAVASESGVVEQKEWTLDMFQRTSSHQIIEELERRLGVSPLEAGNTMASSDPQKDVTVPQAQEAFHSLGVPEE